MNNEHGGENLSRPQVFSGCHQSGGEPGRHESAHR